MMPAESDQVSALILAGGRSSRMGTDKALLPWKGIPLLERVCRVAGQCCSSVSVLTPWPQRYQPIISVPVQFIEEATPQQGPLIALGQGLEEISSPWILLLACDLPCLESQVLQVWSRKLRGLPESLLAQVPYHQERWEPLCGFYHRRCLPQLQSFIAQGGRSFQGWLEQIPVQKLAVNETTAAMLRNCNTPEDLASS
ncbi:MAG: molybdenum cofactor guanylyltransferase [Cyanobacteria bacterium P01_A01_bin.17]